MTLLRYRKVRRSASCVAAALVAALLLAPKARAATFTWDGNAPGGTGNAKWTTVTNWNPDGAPPLSGADIVFAGTLKLTPAMDNNYSILSLTFSGASAFNLTSNGAEVLTIGTGGITNNNTNATGQTITSALILGGAQTWNAASGPLVINSATVNNGGFLLTISGASNTSIASVISGAGGLTKSGAGTLTLSGANTYTGATTISAGSILVGANAPSGSAGALGNASSAVVLGNAATTTNNSSVSLLTNGAFTIGRAITVANQATTGTYKIGGNTDNNSTFSGLITINQNLTVSQVANAGANALSITGGITSGNAGAKTVTFAGPGNINVGTTAISNGGGGTLAVNVTGGKTTFNIANTYTGLTNITGGTLVEGVSNAISTGDLTVNGATAVFDLGANHTDSVGIVTLDGGGSIIGTGTSALTSTGSFEMKSGSASAILAGSGIALNKTTGGTVTLSGPNTYTGGTNVNGGTLALGSSGAIGTTGTISFGGGTLQFSAANTTDYSSRFSNAASQQYSVDTNGQNVTFATALTSSGGTFTKSGTGTLIFTGNNSYDGATTIGGGGTLQLGNGVTTGSLSTSSTITDNGNLTINRSNAVTQGTDFSGSAISGGGSFTQAGSGTTTLNAANAYTGGTTVSAGTLLVNNTTGSGTGTGAVTVNGSGTTLGGTGTISGAVQISNTTAGAILNPGANSTTAGTLTTGALTLSSTNANTFHIDAFGTAATDWDKLVSTAAVVLGNSASTLQVNITSGLTFTAGQTYTLLNGTSLTGTFNGINDNDLVTFSGYQFTADYTGTEFDLIAVPEPSTWFAAALALGAIGFAQRKRVRVYASSAAKKHS